MSACASSRMRLLAGSSLTGASMSNTRERTRHVAVHAGDFRCRRCWRWHRLHWPHAGQGEDVGVGAREDAAVAFHDHAGGGLNVAGAAVVAEALPRLEQVLLGRGGDGGHVGEAFHPAQEIPDAPVHLRLLHHDFRNPRPVGRVVGPPRQRAAVLREPAEQVFSEKRKALRIVHGERGCRLDRGANAAFRFSVVLASAVRRSRCGVEGARGTALVGKPAATAFLGPLPPQPVS